SATSSLSLHDALPICFVVHRDAVASGFFDRCEVFLRRLRHQVAVDESTVVMDELRDRLEHDRPHRDRLDEVSVADVVMKDAYARSEEHTSELQSRGHL